MFYIIAYFLYCIDWVITFRRDHTAWPFKYNLIVISMFFVSWSSIQIFIVLPPITYCIPWSFNLMFSPELLVKLESFLMSWYFNNVRYWIYEIILDRGLGSIQLFIYGVCIGRDQLRMKLARLHVFFNMSCDYMLRFIKVSQTSLIFSLFSSSTSSVMICWMLTAVYVHRLFTFFFKTR